jgi:hypothetical protein
MAIAVVSAQPVKPKPNTPQCIEKENKKENATFEIWDSMILL